MPLEPPELSQTLEERLAELECQLASARGELGRLQIMEAALSAAANAILITDRDGRIQWANDAFCRLSGYSQSELHGENPRLFQSGTHDESFYRKLWNTILAGKVWSNEVVERHKDGHFYIVQETISPIRHENGAVTHFIAVYEDMTTRKESESRIQHLAYHDALTDLPNRLLFQNRLPQAMAQAQRSGRMLALHFIDLDHFKVINDTLGHSVGDTILREIGQRLRSCVRTGDLVARLGGDEFAILQSDLSRLDGASVLARKVIDTLSEPMTAAGQELRITPSIGITVYPLDDSEPDQLLRNADLAMYQAKKSGRGIYQFFTAALTTEIRERLTMERELHRAFEHGEFVLEYQPQVDLLTRKLAGIEALLRWNHPVRGRLLPHDFLQPAEECGKIESLTHWVLEQVAQQVTRWRALPIILPRIAVNVSPVNFRRGHLAEEVANITARAGLPHDWLEIDVNESNLFRETAVIDTVQKMHSRGVAFAIEEFGTGYSSMQYLRRLRIARLKIAAQFVLQLPADRDAAAIVHAIIDLGHRLDLKICAIGIETPAQLQFLCERGCDHGQGYLFQPPLPAAQVTRRLQEGEWR